jgi:hypothetical protein
MRVSNLAAIHLMVYWAYTQVLNGSTNGLIDPRPASLRQSSV